MLKDNSATGWKLEANLCDLQELLEFLMKEKEFMFFKEMIMNVLVIKRNLNLNE